MSKRLANIKRTFFLYQMTIVVGALAVFFFLVVSGYIQNAKAVIREDLDKTARFIIEHVKRGENVPEMPWGEYVYFVLNMEDGVYVIPRQDADESGGRFWENFRTKLTYQMQKQKSGQITYPAKAPKEIFKSTRILQYSLLSDSGWIVVTETRWPGEWELLKNIMGKNDLINLGISVFAGLFLLKFITNIYFVRLEGHIVDTHEYNLGNFNQNISRSSSLKSKVSKTSIPKIKTSRNMPSGIQSMGSGQLESKSKMVFSENALGANINSKPVMSPKSTTTPKAQPVSQKKETRMPIQEVPKAVEKPMTAVNEETHLSQKSYGQKSVEDLEGIKSPALKKLLEEMRSQKKSG